jgi:hypothetical protein
MSRLDNTLSIYFKISLAWMYLLKNKFDIDAFPNTDINMYNEKYGKVGRNEGDIC